MTPPPLARALLTRAVPDDPSGKSIVADLDEEFRERRARGGHLRATWWYWRQAIGVWGWSAARHPHGSHHMPRGGALFDVIGDARYALRVARKAPGQSLLIVLTLALAIGTTTIGFSFADTLLLRGLPIADADRTVIIYAVDARDPSRRTGTFGSDVHAFRDRVRTVEALSSWVQTRVTLARSGTDLARVTVLRTTGDLFGVWGLGVQLGRGLRPGDDAPGAMPVAVLTDRFWTEQYARSPRAVGQTVMIDARAHEIVGVLTPAFEFGNFANLAMAVSYPLERTLERDLRPFMITGRLAAGVSVEQAHAEFQTITAQLEREHPETNRGRQALVLVSRRAFGGPNLFLALTLIVGTAALVTLIASINVAGVLLSRAVVRQREFALRVALGARRGRVFRQLAIEGLLLASGGAAGGLFVAECGLRVIRSVDAEPIFQQIVLDWHELAFVIGLALVAPLIFSLAPALAALRVNLVAALNAGSIRTLGMGRRLREALVVSQLALAVALAIVGGLIARTAVSQMQAQDGFERVGVLRFTLGLDAADAGVARRQLSALRAELLARGAVDAGAMDVVPATSVESTTSFRIDGSELPAEPWANVVRVDESALATLQVPLVRGRSFTASEIDRDAAVALVSLETAKRYFDGADVLGRHVHIRAGNDHVAYQIIGVTGDVRNTEPEDGMPPRVWLPLAEPRTVTVLARFDADAGTATEAIRQVARTTLPAIPVEALEPLGTTIARMQGGDRVAMSMPIGFALVSVVFAAIGLYGTVSLTTNLRRAEFATRFALGAAAGDVTRLVLRHAFVLLLFGLVPGAVLGVLCGIAMRSMLFGVTPLDPGNLAGTVVLLTVITLAASAGPALRAARVDVMALLRG